MHVIKLKTYMHEHIVSLVKTEPNQMCCATYYACHPVCLYRAPSSSTHHFDNHRDRLLHLCMLPELTFTLN